MVTMDVGLLQKNGKQTLTTYSDIVQGARAAHVAGRTLPLSFRAHQLRSLLRMYEEHAAQMVCALGTDLRKSTQETLTTEVEVLKNDVKNTLMHLEEWAKPERPPKGLPHILDKVSIYHEPFGVVLVIGSWNYPLQLLLLPLAGAIAAGNCVVVKPSELCPVTASLIAELLPHYLDTQCYPVVLGGAPETTELLRERFDYVFFTGSTPVGRIVREAANKHLTPVTLELGGKSPVYLAASADLDMSVRRILWGKCLNAGQTCIAPDYLLCSKEVQEKFVAKAAQVLREWYGDDWRKSPDLCRIVTDRHYQRLIGYLQGNGRIAVGGDCDVTERFISPTILVDVKREDPIMHEEIFGPILPILTVKDAQEAASFINSGEKPLAVYVFSANADEQQFLIDHVPCGGVCVNDVILHVTVETLPFGGVGSSGMGAYHGKYTYDTFTHKKGVLARNFGALGEKLAAARYPPYSEKKTRFMIFALSKRREFKLTYLTHLLVFALGIAVTLIVPLLARRL